MADRNVFALKCSQCQNQNYFHERGKKKRPDRKKVETQKFCSNCGRHVMHREAKL